MLICRQLPAKVTLNAAIAMTFQHQALSHGVTPTSPTRPSSLDLREEELADEAVEAGLLEASFFRRRVLSRPFSLGEGTGVPRGDTGSCAR